MTQSEARSSAGIIQGLTALKEKFNGLSWLTEPFSEDDKNQFILQLSALSSARMSPGIPENMGSQAMYKIESIKDRDTLRDFLSNALGITDQESLEITCHELYDYQTEFDTFKSFWAGRPEFDLNELNPEGRVSFEAALSFAEELRSVVGNLGFLGWDINERIGLYRRAYAAQLISEEDFWDETVSYYFRVSAYYDNWGEFALSCLAGAAYFMFRESDGNWEEVQGVFDINYRIVDAYTDEGGLWREASWPKKNGKAFATPARDMIELLLDYEGPLACLASDRIMVDGKKVGYMYREEPDYESDSGWRFLAGDESDDYINSPDNVGVYSLNTLANADLDILDYLDAPEGSAFVREGEKLIPVRD